MTLPRHSEPPGRSVIGQFAFEDSPSSCHVLLELGWRNGEPVGRLIAPPAVLTSMQDRLALRAEDDFMILPLALGYAITIASTANVPLTLTGDRTAWPASFGPLTRRQPSRPRFH